MYMYMLYNILIVGQIHPLAMWQKLMTAQDFVFSQFSSYYSNQHWEKSEIIFWK